MKPLLSITLADPDSDRVRRSHADAIGDLQGSAQSAARIVENVRLADGVATPVAHGLPKAPRWVQASAPRGPISAGLIEEIRVGTDRSRVVVLRATGYGTTISVDVMVAP